MNAEKIEAVLWTLRHAINGVQARISISERDSLLATVLIDVRDKLDKHRLEMQAAEAATVKDIPDSEISDDAAPSWIRLDRIEKRLDAAETDLAEQHCQIADVASCAIECIKERLAEIERKAKITDEQIEVFTGGLRLDSLANLGKRIDEVEAWQGQNGIPLSDIRLDPHMPIGGPCADEPTATEPAPPIEVEMRATELNSGGYKWECRLACCWLQAHVVTCQSARVAQGDAANWLAALSNRLGLNLVAKWIMDAPCPPPASG